MVTKATSRQSSRPRRCTGWAASASRSAAAGNTLGMPWALMAIRLTALLDPQQRAVADAGDLARPRAARHAHADLGRRAVRLLVPFGRNRDQFAVGIAAADIGEHDRGQGAGMVQLLLALLHMAFVG